MREKNLQVYKTDCARNIGENIAKLVAIQGHGKVEAKYLSKRYIELTSSSQPESEKTAEEIIADIIIRAKKEAGMAE